MRIDLKNFRQAHQLFQSEAAELLGINQSNVSRAELKGFFDLNFLQRKKLIEKYGQEDVESFRIPDGKQGNTTVNATGIRNEGEGTQNFGYFGADTTAMGIIRQQSEALTKLADKQSSLNERLLALLEKLSGKF